MTKLLALGFIVALLFCANAQIGAAPPDHNPRVEVRDDPAANGWQVRISFKEKPGAFARAGHAWTRSHAEELGRRAMADHGTGPADHSVEKVEVVGQDGEGKVDPKRGPHPQLPDPLLVEQQLRARTSAKPELVDQHLPALRRSYQKAADAFDKAVARVRRQNGPTATEKAVEKAVEDAFKNYNAKLDEFNKLLGGPQPAPYLKIPPPAYLYDHVKEHDDYQGAKASVEQFDLQVRKEAAQANQERARIAEAHKNWLRDRERAQDLVSVSAQQQNVNSSLSAFEKTMEDYRKKQATLAEAQRALAQQGASIASRFVDFSPITPPAKDFSSSGNAVITAVPGPVVVKAGAGNKSLSETAQPEGYPKRYEGGPLNPGERVVVEPGLMIQAQQPDPGDVRAAAGGTVTRVDEQRGIVEIQVTPEFSYQVAGVKPSGVVVGGYVGKGGSIGSWQPSPQPRALPRLLVTATNRARQLVNPGPVLNQGQQSPATSGQLAEDPAVPPETLPLKGDGDTLDKALSGAKFEYDATPDKDRSKDLRSAREVLAGAEAEKAKQEEERQAAEAGILAAKQREFERDLKKAQSQLKEITEKSEKLVDRVKSSLQKKKELDAEGTKLTENQKVLQVEAARVSVSKDAKSAAELNKRIEDHNRWDQKWKSEYNVVSAELAGLQTEITTLKRDRSRAEEEEKRLNRDLKQAVTKQETAAAALKKAREERMKREQEVAAARELEKNRSDATKAVTSGAESGKSEQSGGK